MAIFQFALLGILSRALYYRCSQNVEEEENNYIRMGNTIQGESSEESLSEETKTKSIIRKKKEKKPPKPITRPFPKHLLWGCTTAEEHYSTIENTCKVISKEHGLEGLRKIGFDYQLVHATNPCPHCLYVDDDDDVDNNNEYNNNNNNDVDSNNNDFFIDDEEEESLSSGGGNEEKKEEKIDGKRTTTTTTTNVLNEENININNESMIDENVEEEAEGKTYMVPVGQPLTRNNNRNNNNKQSTASLFSLATHHSRTSSTGSSSGNNSYSNEENELIYGNCCTHRLFHIPSGGTMITERNHTTFIASGLMYDEIARLCMEYAQDCMITEGNLEWKIVCPERQIKALMSTSTYSTPSTPHSEEEENTEIPIEESQQQHESNSNNNNDEDQNDEINKNNNSRIKEQQVEENDISEEQLLAETIARITARLKKVAKEEDDDKERILQSNKKKTNKDTLVIITGKGKVGAGIFSRRLLMTMGLEPATAISFVREARKRNMNQVILDPNSMKKEEDCHQEDEEGNDDNNNKIAALDIVDACLQNLFFDHHHNVYNKMFVLAHSMAGSQLIRFLLNKANLNNNNSNSIISKDDNDNDNSHVGNDNDQDMIQNYYLNTISAVAFTDSNHNLQWCKNFVALKEYFESSRCLYVKSQTVHENVYKQVGTTFEPGNHIKYDYWKHRFGTIRTVYAGTKEHSLTNHTARHHIWSHFDSFSIKKK